LTQQQQQQRDVARKIREKRTESRNRQKEFQKIEKSSQLIREDPNTLLPKPHFGLQATKTNQGCHFLQHFIRTYFVQKVVQSQTLRREKTFVRKIFAFSVDEIDHRLSFSSTFYSRVFCAKGCLKPNSKERKDFRT